MRRTVTYEPTNYGVPWLRRKELLAAASKEKLNLKENYALVALQKPDGNSKRVANAEGFPMNARLVQQPIAC